MSVVSNVVLVTAIDEPGTAAVNAWLAAAGFGPLARVEQHAGGNKAFECDLYAAAYNYFLTDEFIAALSAIEWRGAENVSLIIEPQEGPHIRWQPA